MNDRLLKAFEDLRALKKVKNQADFGTQLEVGKTYFSQVMNGAKPMTYKLATKIETVFSIKANWLMKGEGEMFVNDNTKHRLKTDTTNDRGEVSLSLTKIEEEEMVGKYLWIVEQNTRVMSANAKIIEGLVSTARTLSDTNERLSLILDRLTGGANEAKKDRA